MEKKINYSKSFKAIDEFFEKYNDGKTMGDKTRLKANTKATAYAIIRLYGNYLYSKKMLFVKGTIGAELCNDIPPLSTNNIRIAEHINTTDRTVRNHIKKLVDVGLIVKKVNHGKLNNFELWLNPEILGIKKKLDLKEIQAKISKEIINSNTEEINQKNEALNLSQRKNLPLNVSCDTETKNLDNTNNTTVDKESLKSDNISVSSKAETKDTEQETRESKTTKNSNPTKKLKKISSKQKVSPENKEVSPKKIELEKHIKSLIDFLWSLSVSLIYNDMELEEHQQIIAKRHFQQFFKKATSKEIASRWYKQYCKRITMASIYYKNHPEYEKHLPSFYFDPENEKGFRATKGWYVKYTTSKLKQAKNRLLSLSIRQIEAAPNDAGIYLTVQQRINKFNDQELMDRFNKKVLEIQKQND